MPIHIDIRVNDELIKQVHIGRDEIFGATDKTHRYMVTDQVHMTRADFYGKDAKTFMHKYDDGLEICVRKGLEALYG